MASSMACSLPMQPSSSSPWARTNKAARSTQRDRCARTSWSIPASGTARPTIDSCWMRVVARRSGNRPEVVRVCHNEPNGAAIRDGITMTYTRLQAGEVRLLDGATGTELEKRGVPMSTNAWSGSAALDHPETLEQIHRDYIDAGADIITANTYATSRALLELDGLGDRFETINRAAVRAACQARDRSGRPEVIIAGSLSHRGPIATGSARPDSGAIGLETMADALREQAQLLRDEGCDLLLLEM
ncbi:MAG TPA: homocysteine S-methyltransferase family protein, partial [Halothiobacillaceae bacterium]|nr:homocysteine S-methyltransferase family protein [Halothiobacillaceae bacterium]